MTKHTSEQVMSIQARAGVSVESVCGVDVDTLNLTPIAASTHVALQSTKRTSRLPHIAAIALLAVSAAIAPVLMTAAPAHATTAKPASVRVYSLPGVGLSLNARTQIRAAGGVVPCRYEDSNNCFWDARFMGNHHGRNFITWHGVTFMAPAATRGL